MGRQSVPFLAFNRGLISPKALARVDLDRTRLSAERFNNFICKTQGALTIRPGTKWLGSSLRDSGAEWVEFVASTDDVALCELTDDTMRIWLGSDAHALALLSRPKVDTTVALSDTGWSNASTGGAFATPGVDLIPTMTAATTNGVTITASSENAVSSTITGPAWHAADDDLATLWLDTGTDGSTLPSWLNVDFGSDTGNRKVVRSYSLRAGDQAGYLDNAPKAWRLIGSHFDTGTFATDTGKWKLEDERSAQTAWAVSEKRTFSAQGDTGLTAWRHWRLYVVTVDGDTELIIAEVELFPPDGSNQAQVNNGELTLNATSIGALAKTKKRVIVSDTGTEHSLAIRVNPGPVTLRVGSSDGDDDYIREANLGTGYHNLAFTPTTNFHITLQSDAVADRIVSSLAIGDSGTVEITAPWETNDLGSVRYDQSADVVFADNPKVLPFIRCRAGAKV